MPGPLLPVAEMHDMLAAKLSRPVRVLDLGCAQGVFSFNLAQRGATVHGIDYVWNNVALCQTLVAEHPKLKVTFEKAYVEQTIARLPAGQFDLVLGLSVSHHIVYRTGAPLVRHMLTLLADKVAVGIYEMAQPSDPTELGKMQPDDPRCLLDGYNFMREIAQHTTHVGVAMRPMYAASNRPWFLAGAGDAVMREPLIECETATW